MKKQIQLLLLILALIPGTVLAQAPANKKKSKTVEPARPYQSPEERALTETNKAEKRLGLNADQKKQWHQAALTRIQANKPIIEQMQVATTPGEKKILRDKIQSNGLTFDQTVTEMLNADQKGLWINWKAEKKKQMKKKAKQKKMAEDEFED